MVGCFFPTAIPRTNREAVTIFGPLDSRRAGWIFSVMEVSADWLITRSLRMAVS